MWSSLDLSNMVNDGIRHVWQPLELEYINNN